MNATDVLRLVVGTLLILVGVYYIRALEPTMRAKHGVARTISPRLCSVYWILAWVLVVGSGTALSASLVDMMSK